MQERSPLSTRPSGRNYMVAAQPLRTSALFSSPGMAPLVPLPPLGGCRLGLSAKYGILVLAVFLVLSLACSRQTALPDADAAKSDASQKLPFDRQPQSAGISPSHSLLPSVTRLPEGTPVTICLQHELSSASAQPGDSFAATLDAPIVIDGQTVVWRGATLAGRVLDAKHSTGPSDPGYLRLALVSLTVGEKVLPIETSSLFAKGGSREDRSSAMIGVGAVQKEIVIGPERRLSLRLAQALDLQ
jgi:hypothetical protein